MRHVVMLRVRGWWPDALLCGDTKWMEVNMECELKMCCFCDSPPRLRWCHNTDMKTTAHLGIWCFFLAPSFVYGKDRVNVRLLVSRLGAVKTSKWHLCRCHKIGSLGAKRTTSMVGCRSTKPSFASPVATVSL